MANYKKTLSFSIPAGSIYQPEIPAGKVYVVERVACNEVVSAGYGSKPRYLLAIYMEPTIIKITDYYLPLKALTNPDLLLWDGVQVYFFNSYSADINITLICNVIEEYNNSFVEFEDGIIEVPANSGKSISFTGYSGVKIPFWAFTIFNTTFTDYSYACNVSLLKDAIARPIHHRDFAPSNMYNRGFFVDEGYAIQIYNPTDTAGYFYYQAVKFKHI